SVFLPLCLFPSLSLTGDSRHLSELRIVLLGGRRAEKSSSGNTILGREEFDLRTAAQCVKRQGEVAGRQVTVVDTPGWRWNLPVERTTELVKQEIVHSVPLCPPGPHTLLLVIDLSDSFREDERRSVEGHLQLLSKRVWSHTIVLFTRGDRLGDTTIEQHIETEGKALQWLVEKCGNRYHVLNNENRDDDTQVTELLDKVEEMVAGNRGGHYEMDREILEKMEERRRAEEEGAQQRRMKVQEQRETLRSLMSDSLHLSELRIVLLGGRSAGKSSSGNTILGREEFDLRTTAQCVKRQGEIAGRQVIVVDTPGWWRKLPIEWTTELVKQKIVHSMFLCPPGPHTLLLVIDLSDSFREDERRSVEGHLQLLSERVWSHTIVLFTRGDCLGDTTIEQHIETEGKVLQWLVEKCGNRYHVLNNENRGDDSRVTELLDKVEEMVAGNRGGHFEMDRQILGKMEIWRRTKEMRAKQREAKVMKHRETLRTFISDSLHLSELRIVLLGGRGDGKSSSGNTILGREEFDLRTAAQCVKRQGEVAGRQVTVVDTPGWRWNLPVERTTELVKQEIVRSVSLCPPGPHTLLLVIDLDDSFREEHRRSVEGHLQLLSERVWSHTIVLFTHGDCLGDTTIEQHIETEGKALQWLVEKCGNRYHVLNNKNRGDDTQVTELLDKVEKMVAGNRGGHYEMDREILEKVEVWRKSKEMRAKQREAKVMEQREIHRTFISDFLHLSELRIVLLGGRGEGKSSSGNTILGREEFDLRTTDQCLKRQGEVAGRQVTVVDTPGWWRYFPVEDTTNLVKQEIVHSVSLCPPGPHTILLVINLDDSFREEEASSIEGNLQLLSERVWSHTIVLFTCGDCLEDTTIEQHIETEGKVLQWLVEKCGNRYHVLNNKNRGDDTQVTELLDKVEEMVAANSGDVFHPQMDVSKEINWSSEEYQMSPLPVTKVRSIDIPPNMSGDSRAETDCDSGWKSEAGSEAGSLLTPEKWGGGRSDVLSLRSSGYGSQTSRPSGSAEEQLRCARLAFVERVSKPVLDYLLDGLLQESVINNAEKDEAKVETQRAERARATIDMVLRKGDESCSVMRRLLCDMDPYLYSTLGFK
ncbi:GTPase IMAP family member 8-like, partial [Osmerus eperlanus]|uniref:GTPase IMAP family member 8-like n=1 Tax=Osmerus eperlanus TaxID=29151 RepID=UPI002E10A0FC